MTLPPVTKWALAFCLLLLSACDSSEPEDSPPGRDDEFDVGCDASTAVPVDPKGTYLRVAPRDAAVAPTVIRLADVNVRPGDDVTLERFGEYLYAGTNPANTLDDLIAVFSTSDEVLDGDARARVPGALDAGEDVVTKRTFFDSLETDVPEDFAVESRTTVRVPAGAAYLLVAPNDSEYQNNTDTDNDFRVCVTK